MNATNQRPNPYVGPRAFRVGETLYGRNRELRELLDLLIAERIILLHSPSGAGKSSLIQAGLIPSLQKEGFSVLPLIRVNLEPASGPATSTPTDPGNNQSSFNRYIYSTLLSLEEGLPAESQLSEAELAQTSLPEYLEKRIQLEIADKEADSSDSVVLIFDQFEEILTIDPTDRQNKAAFFAELGAALRNRKLWALFSMREDYIAALDPYLRPIPTRMGNTYRLDLLGVQAARQAIQMPARSQEVDFTNAAAQKLVDDLRRIQIQQPDGTLQEQLGIYVEPVQLQVVCYRLWQNLEAEKNNITEADVENVGDVDQSLSEYYAERVASAAQQTQVSERIARDWFDQRLITESGIRGQVLMGADKSDGLDNRTIRLLENAHLVRGEKRRGATWFELAHDRLIGPVRRNNLDWYQVNLILLQRQAAQWLKENRPDHLLLRDQALVEAEEWATAHPDELTAGDQEFLEACQELRQREQAERERAEQAVKLEAAEKVAEAERKRAEEQARSARKLRQRAIFLAVLLLVAVGLAGAAGYLGNLATQESRAANTARAEAVTQQNLAEANAVLAQNNEATAEAERAIAVEERIAADTARAVAEEERNAASTARALEAEQRSKAETEAVARATAQAEALVQKDIALSRQRAAFSVGYIEEQTDLALLLAVEAYRTADTLEARSALLSGLQRGLGRKFKRLPIPPAVKSVYSVAMSTDGRLMAWGTEDGTVTVWDYQEGKPIYSLSDSPSRVWSVAFSPDGKILASASENSFVALWDVASGERIARFPNLNKVLSVSWSPDSQRLAVATGPHVVVWDIAGKTRFTEQDQVFDNNLRFVVSEVAWSPDGKMIAAACENSIVYILEPETGAISKQLAGHQNKVKSVAWSPSSTLLASGGDDFNVLLWDVSSTQAIQTLEGHTDNVISVAFSFDGTLLASGGDTLDGSIIVWDAQTYQTLAQLSDNSLSIESVVFIPKAGDTLLASGSRDASISLYEVTTEQPLNRSLVTGGGEIIASGVDQSGANLLARYSDTQADLKVTKLVDGSEQELRSALSSFRRLKSAAFSPDGKSLAYSTDNGRLI
ncbi:MAG: PD40 domain-containing protein, partial [Anaerolineales bacterium]